MEGLGAIKTLITTCLNFYCGVHLLNAEDRREMLVSGTDKNTRGSARVHFSVRTITKAHTHTHRHTQGSVLLKACESHRHGNANNFDQQLKFSDQ